MKILTKRWVKILLAAAFLLSVNSAVFFGALAVFGKETGCQQKEEESLEYWTTTNFMSVMGLQTRGLVQSLCEWGQYRQEELSRKISVQEFDLTEEEGEASSLKSIPVKNTNMTWKEYLEEQGVDFSAGYSLNGDEYLKGALPTYENAEEEIICESGIEMLTESCFIRLKTEDFLSLFEAYPGKWMWRRPETEGTEATDENSDENGDSEEDVASENLGYNFEELGDIPDIDLSDFSEESRVYKQGEDYLIYDKARGRISGSRMQPVSVSGLKEAQYVYFSLKDETEKKPEQWMDDIVRGFTTSLVRQEACGVFGLHQELWDQEWAHSYGYIDAIQIFHEGKPFVTYGEAEEASLHMTFAGEETKAVFDKYSLVSQDSYQVELYFNEEIMDSGWYAITEYLYSTYQIFGGFASKAAVMGALLSLLFGVLLLVAFLPPLWQRTEEKRRDKCPMEIWFLFVFVYAAVAAWLLYSFVEGLPQYGAVSYLLRNYSVGWTLFGYAALLELLTGLGLALLYLSVSVLLFRWKNHCFLRGFLVIRGLLWIARKIKYIAHKIKYAVKKVMQNFDILKRRILFLTLIWVPSFLIMLVVSIYAGNSGGFIGVFAMFCYLVFMLGFSYMQMKDALDNKRLLAGCNRMQNGALGEKIDTKGLYSDKLELAEAINSMGEGLEKAVQTSMKDERMKAELITNVSHDIKTPLTSIINYVDLLKREGITPEEKMEYLKILDVKSQRLKQLIEDLVEVSKTSTGNVELQMTPLDFMELLNQALGEFQEKFEERRLELIVSHAEHKIRIWADGRRCYRILENLFQNVYKYAMPGTRVYVELAQKEKELIFTIKNISEAPLNIPVEELMERFVRGDVSRTTSGSGLGLSIAQNLVTLQKGTFQIMLDGDLFKVEIRFPVLTSEASPEH